MKKDYKFEILEVRKVYNTLWQYNEELEDRREFSGTYESLVIEFRDMENEAICEMEINDCEEGCHYRDTEVDDDDIEEYERRMEELYDNKKRICQDLLGQLCTHFEHLPFYDNLFIALVEEIESGEDEDDEEEEEIDLIGILEEDIRLLEVKVKEKDTLIQFLEEKLYQAIARANEKEGN